MKTIVIKNRSTLRDERVAYIVYEHLSSLSNEQYASSFEDSKKHFKLKIKISESASDNKVTYTVLDDTNS